MTPHRLLKKHLTEQEYQELCRIDVEIGLIPFKTREEAMEDLMWAVERGDPARVLANMFHWEYSIQGEEYWEIIYARLNGEDCAIVPSLVEQPFRRIDDER